MTTEQKIEDAKNWLSKQTEEVRSTAFEQLLEFAIEAEWIGVWHPEDREELAAESGKPVSEYEAPYFRTSGTPLGQ
jgi:hypothetical protein